MRCNMKNQYINIRTGEVINTIQMYILIKQNKHNDEWVKISK
jgi:hypothetical protein